MRERRNKHKSRRERERRIWNARPGKKKEEKELKEERGKIEGRENQSEKNTERRRKEAGKEVIHVRKNEARNEKG